jgi:hypothetical protein
MGEEADADWDAGLIEAGIEDTKKWVGDVRFQAMGQCKYWPACACGPSNGRRRQPDPCGRLTRRRRRVGSVSTPEVKP